MVDHPVLGWRWCFFVAVPLVALAMLVIESTFAPATRLRARQPLDRLGGALVSGCILVAVLLLTMGGNRIPWLSPWTAALAALAIGLLLAAAAQERRAADPVLPPRLFAVRTFRLAGFGLIVTGAVMYGALTYLPLYLQIVKGMAPTAAGLLILPMVVAMVGAGTVVGWLVTASGRWKVYPVAGTAVSGLGMLLLSRLGSGSSLVMAGVDMAVVGAGLGMTGQVLILACQNEAEQRDLGVVSATASFLRSLGGAFGVALLGGVLSSQLVSTVPALLRERGFTMAAPDTHALLGTPAAVAHLPAGLRSAVVDGLAQSLDLVFLVTVPLSLLGLLAVTLLRERPLRAARFEAEGVDDQPAVVGLVLEATA
jgi:MFS family permease